MILSFSFCQCDSDFLITRDDTEFTGFYEPFSILVYEGKVTHRVYLESECARLAGRYQFLLEMLEFLYRAGDGGVRVADVPLYSLFLTVTLAVTVSLTVKLSAETLMAPYSYEV